MKSNKTDGHPVSIKIDPMGLARLAWIKAHSSDLNPSTPMILRRALAFYFNHFERTLKDAELFDLELVTLRQSAQGEDVAWRTMPDFSASPGKTLHEYSVEIHRRRLDSFLNNYKRG